MKKLSRVEAAKIKKRTGPDLHRWLYDALRELAEGDSVIVEKADWKGKDHFTHAIHSVHKRQFSVRTLTDGSGWLVTKK